MVDSDIVAACNYLKWKQIPLPLSNLWLQSCVEFFKNENVTYSKNDLQKFVYEQWTLADLKDVACPSLPESINRESFFTFKSSGCPVQIHMALNVAASAYKQLQRIRKPESEGNLEVSAEPVEKTHGRRALKLEMFDGVTTVIGFEVEPIPSLLDNLIPGTKALLIGPIECIKGVLMLKKSNIQLIGGEVDTLHLEYAPENVLARRLGVSENPDPFKSAPLEATLDDGDDEALLLVAEQVETQLSEKTLLPYSLETVKPNTQSNSDIAALELMDCDLDEDFELIAAHAATIVEKNHSCFPSPTSHSTKKKVQSSLESFISSQGRPSKPLATSTQKTLDSFMNPPLVQSSENIVNDPKGLKRPSSSSIIKGDLCKDDGLPMQDYIDAVSVPKKRKDGCHSDTSFPPCSFPTVTTVDGEVIRLTEKLCLKNEKWSLSALVKAKGHEVEADFSSDALDKVFGITAKDLMSKKREMQLNPAMKEKINEILRKSQQRIKTLKCPMVFKFSSEREKPLIVNIHDIS